MRGVLVFVSVIGGKEAVDFVNGVGFRGKMERVIEADVFILVHCVFWDLQSELLRPLVLRERYCRSRRIRITRSRYTVCLCGFR